MHNVQFRIPASSKIVPFQFDTFALCIDATQNGELVFAGWICFIPAKGHTWKMTECTEVNGVVERKTSQISPILLSPLNLKFTRISWPDIYFSRQISLGRIDSLSTQIYENPLLV